MSLPMPGASVSVDDLIAPCFESIGPGYASKYGRGQIYWTHTYYPHEHLQVWRPKSVDAVTGIASAFDPVTSAKDLFRRVAPLTSPSLKTSEEFLVIRGKRRPVVLLADMPPDTGIAPVRGGGRIERHFAICAPFYSIDHQVT